VETSVALLRRSLSHLLVRLAAVRAARASLLITAVQCTGTDEATRVFDEQREAGELINVGASRRGAWHGDAVLFECFGSQPDDGGSDQSLVSGRRCLASRMVSRGMGAFDAQTGSSLWSKVSRTLGARTGLDPRRDGSATWAFVKAAA
jgi:hypothetical protein